jgi:nicotinamidase/pyrazinamidase
MNMTINLATDALIVIDPQNDFCPGGALAVPEGDNIMSGIDEFAEKFGMVVLTQDWHPENHKSFASAHGVAPFSTVAMPYGEQVAWPDHCVQGRWGAEFHYVINRTVNRAKLILRKGYNPEVDSYSAFYENDKTTKTGLAGFLRDKGVKRCFFVGLAFDFCVAYSALDAVKEGFAAVVIEDLTRAIAMPVEGSGGLTTRDTAVSDMIAAGVTIS